MNQERKNILEDLYQADPTLKKYEAQLIRLIETLLSVRPETQIDEKFRLELRTKLLQQAIEIKQKNSSQNQFINFINMNRLKLISAGFAAFVLLVAVGIYYSGVGRIAQISLLSDQQNISNISERAFGDLAVVTGGGFGGGRNQSGGGGGGAEVSTGIGGGGVTASEFVPPYIPTKYKYVYVGDDLDLSESEVSVLRRLKQDSSSRDLAKILSRASLGLINLGSFQNSELQMFNIAENKENGYVVSVDLSNSTISVFSYWLKWTQLSPLCYGDGCPPDSQRLTFADIPSDETLIATATKFLADHSIPTANLGTPFVDNQWRLYAERETNPAYQYIPEILSVVFPQIVDGQVTHDEGGRPTGVNVSINIRRNMVEGAWGMTVQNYEASNYPMIQDTQKVLSIVERGGLYAYQPDFAERTVEVEVGTPKRELVKMYYNPTGAVEASEILVPALIFPVLNPPDELMYQQSIVVPLVQDIIDAVSPGPIPYPVDTLEQPAIEPEQ